MQRYFIDNPTFRLLAPPVYGTLVYIQVLLAFDSAGELLENYFSQEQLLCILLTFLVFELNRLIIKILQQKSHVWKGRLRKQIISQLFFSLLSTALLVSSILSLYFSQLVGLSVFTVELLIFNLIFTITSVLYNLLYISVLYLGKENETKLREEQELKQKIEHELHRFKNEINPDFFYTSMESLISLLHKDLDLADEFIGKLAAVYRYVLSNRQTELVEINKELSIVNEFLNLLNHKYQNAISLKVQGKGQYWKQVKVIPGTLISLIECIVETTIVNTIQPLVIELYRDSDNYFVMETPLNDRLHLVVERKACINELQRAYSLYSNEPIVKMKAYDKLLIKIPEIKLIEEDNLTTK
ncbi:histidine kinase [Rapidithrix thailandica]|uniref:Histidine kinase n=1 Tax=Rapidithrix thailandica TaxID=413964 RepID=A0AAW9SDZ9_9BACT